LPIISFAQTEKQIHTLRTSIAAQNLGMTYKMTLKEFYQENNTLCRAAKTNGWKLTERLEDGNFSELTSMV